MGIAATSMEALDAVVMVRPVFSNKVQHDAEKDAAAKRSHSRRLSEAFFFISMMAIKALSGELPEEGNGYGEAQPESPWGNKGNSPE
jgi:hypothetical protein